MDPTKPADAREPRMARWVRMIRERDPEEVVRDCVMFIAGTHMIALLYFILKAAKDMVCGS